MSNWQWFFLGMMVAWTPCILFLAWALYMAEDDPYDK